MRFWRNAMPGLAELQEAFARALLADDAGAVLPWLRPGGAAGLAVYRGNLAERGRSALAAVYPVVERLVGEAFFARAAWLYALAHPSRSGDIHDFGGEFAGFLAAYAPAASLSYLPDVARLEWAAHRVFHAADGIPPDPVWLGALPAKACSALGFALAPACRLVTALFPVHHIWAMHQPDALWDSSFLLEKGEVRLLVRRGADYGIACRPLEPAEYALLAAIDAGCALGAAFDRAESAGGDAELAEALRRHLAAGSLVLREPGGEPL